MRIAQRHLASLVVALVVGLVAAGCGSATSTTTTPTTTTTTTDTLFGTVQVPVNGVPQSSFNAFVVGQSGGTITATLTSAIETLPPSGTLLTTVVMGFGIGNVTNGACVLISGGQVTTMSGGSPQLTGSLTAGTYCVLVSDVTNQLGPVAYAVSVTHP